MRPQPSARGARWHKVISLSETALLLLSAPLLIFPTLAPQATAVALAALGLWWLGTALLAGMPAPVTPLNLAMLLWAIAVAVGTLVTADPTTTLPKATNLLLGIATWRLLAGLGAYPRAIKWATTALLVLAVGLATVGSLSIRWTSKVAALRPLLDQLPRNAVTLPEAPVGGVSPNQLGGTLAMLLPVAASHAVQAIRSKDTNHKRLGPEQNWKRVWHWAWSVLGTAAAAIIAALLTTVLILTQSRSSYMGAIVGIISFGVLLGLTTQRRWQQRAAAVFAVLCLIGIVLAVALLGSEHIVALWETKGGIETSLVGKVTLSGRVEIWSRAIYAIQDAPLTGCGLGTFRQVIWSRYPLFNITSGADLAHAHNMFLQAALDAGIPGLIAYAGLLGISVAMAYNVACTRPELRVLALGLLSGLIALHCYGLTDALAPGSKPGLVFWYALGLLTAMHRLAGKGQEESLAKPGSEKIT